MVNLTDQIQITDPDYTDLDYKYGSGLHITGPDYRSGLRNTEQDNFSHDRLKMDQELPHFYTNNFSHDSATIDGLA